MDGRGLLSHSGTAALRELADRIGLTDALSAAAAPVSAAGLIHEPGAVLRDVRSNATAGRWSTTRPAWPA